eukprot:15374-Prymnesium_polylepis.1
MGTHAHGPTPYAPVVSLDTPQRRQSGLAQPQVKDASARRSGQSIETHFGGREHYVESTPHRCRGGLHERHHDGYQLARELHLQARSRTRWLDSAVFEAAPRFSQRRMHEHRRSSAAHRARKHARGGTPRPSCAWGLSRAPAEGSQPQQQRRQQRPHPPPFA